MRNLPVGLLAVASVAVAGVLIIAPATSSLACTATAPPTTARLAKFTSAMTGTMTDSRRDRNLISQLPDRHHDAQLEFVSSEIEPGPTSLGDGVTNEPAAIGGASQIRHRDGTVVVTVPRSCI